MPVTTFAAVVDNVTAPALVALVGAASVTWRVVPVGMAALIAAVTIRFVSLDVTAQVVVASVAEFGAEPAVAVDTVSAPGFPLTEISLMALTEKVTVCWAVLTALAGMTAKKQMAKTASAILNCFIIFISGRSF